MKLSIKKVNSAQKREISEFNREFSNIATAGLIEISFAGLESHCSKRYSVFPVIFTINAPEDWGGRAGGAVAKIEGTLRNLESRIGRLLDCDSDGDLKSSVFFQLGDLPLTFDAWKSAVVFKNSARLAVKNELALPYVVPKIEAMYPIGRAKTLVSFLGTDTHKSRRELNRVINDYRGSQMVLSHLLDAAPLVPKKGYREDYQKLMNDSKFIACPRGTGLTSYRFFEAMQRGRIPILISDDAKIPLPAILDPLIIRIKEDGIDGIFDNIERFVATNDLDSVSLKLKRFSDAYCQLSTINSLINQSLHQNENEVNHA